MLDLLLRVHRSGDEERNLVFSELFVWLSEVVTGRG